MTKIQLTPRPPRYNRNAEAQLTEQQARIDQSAGDSAATAAARAEEVATAAEEARVLDAKGAFRPVHVLFSRYQEILTNVIKRYMLLTN
jgi:hypothetical protein